MQRIVARAGLVVALVAGCNAGPNVGPGQGYQSLLSGSTTPAPAAPTTGTSGTSGGSSSTGTSAGGTTTSGTTTSGSGTTAAVPSSTSAAFPSSQAWMTEAEEVAWINSLGFATTLAELRASYASFKPSAVSSTQNVLWDAETDDLRNWYRLYKRTGHADFLRQAEAWREFYVDTYSNWQNGGTHVIEPSHVYLMGLIDWWLDYKDQATLDAIDRILDFVIVKVGSTFYETRVSARCIQCLGYYVEKIGKRQDVLPKLRDLVAGVEAVKPVSGWVPMRFFVGQKYVIGGMPANQDARTLFPGNAKAGIAVDRDRYDLKGFDGVGTYQDCMLMHALRVAARVLKDPRLDQKATEIASAWLPLVARPFFDSALGYNLLVPYYVVVTAPEPKMFNFPMPSSPNYTTQYSVWCADPNLRRTLQQAALLRAYDELSRVQPSELGKKPRYFPWQTIENGYFLTQK